jgi:lipopolysaccharide export system permease protein
MLRPHVEWAQPAGRRRVIDAESAAYVDGAWLFTNAQERVFSAVAGEFPTLTETKVLSVTEWSETPEEIRSAIKIGKILGPGRVLEFRRAKSAQFSIREILAYKRVAAVDPVLTALLDTKLHGRLAAPWTCLVVVLIALPFGAGLGRRNVFVGVASSILIGFAYFILQQLALALGGGGHVSPWMAAWSPNVLFALTGLGLSARIR